MTELEMIKAFAELDGVNLEEFTSDIDGKFYFIANHRIYNPITDHSLTFKAMVDYGVDVQNCTEFDYWLDGSGSFDIPYICASIKDPEGAHAVTELGDVSIESTSKAIIECILKSKGLWQ